MTGVRRPEGGWGLSFSMGGHHDSESPGTDLVADEEHRREAFDALIDDALDRIPPPFSDLLGTVAVVAEDEPPPERVPYGQILFGLFQGVPRTAWGADNVPVANKISIYRGPHERSYPDPARRAEAVEATVFHEVAHHFGISDDRLRELQHESTRR